MLWNLAFLAILASAQGRAVNISNTWVLPEEGFPVFYRYFRDRISWYEADAVCQFHHANLVTVDTTAQYDAVRAYLKELDILSAVWVGLIRSNPDGDFTWTDYRGLSNEGYWSSAPDSRIAPLCAAANPAADYRWEARACGGPMVASFICELPVPQWALGSEGCMVRSLPALTALYLPESAAVQLTADCGLAGIKSVECTGHVKREELLRDLSCSQDMEDTTSSFTTETTLGTGSTETEGELDIFTTRSLDITTFHPNQESTSTILPVTNKNDAKLNVPKTKIYKNSELNLVTHNNLESNEVPQMVNNTFAAKEKNIVSIIEKPHEIPQYVMKHNEKNFNLPSDHFIPPLVMARARLSEDMDVLTLAEKHAQQLAEHANRKDNPMKEPQSLLNTVLTTEKFDISTASAVSKEINFDDLQKKTEKYGLNKKFPEKIINPKSKHAKVHIKNIIAFNKVNDSVHKEIDISIANTTDILNVLKTNDNSNSEEDSPIDLTVTLKEKNTLNLKTDSSESITKSTTTDSTLDFTTKSLVQEIINITLVNNNLATRTIEVTTLSPIDEATDKISGNKKSVTELSNSYNYTLAHEIKSAINKSDEFITEPILLKDIATQFPLVDATENNKSRHINSSVVKSQTMVFDNLTNTAKVNQSFDAENTTLNSFNLNDSYITDQFIGEGSSIHPAKETIDSDSPLLSAASEPLHRPTRTKRLHSPSRLTKFNLLRILG